MVQAEQKAAAKKFAEYWQDKGDEKSDTQSFWFMLLREIFGVQEPERILEFEKRVKDETTNFIDCYIDSTKVMIEQKSLGKDLRKGIKQSDGSVLSPFQQAKRYITNLPVSKHPRWLITCNFSEFLIYDMEKPNCEPEQIFLKDLPKEYYRLQFLVDTGNDNIRKEMEVSLKAGELVGKLYDLILKQYKNPDSPDTLKSLNKLCVRLVFCLYAESAGIFGKHQMFHDYLKKFPVGEIRTKLIELFKILDTKSENRDAYLDEDLLAFPYVNGGLFADEDIEIPRFTEEIVRLLLHNASEDFDWSDISPTIFGAVFESTLNPETRRSGGMHYTSIENIHKVIDPLFLDDLKAEFADILEIKVNKTRFARLEDFRNKLASLTFLDPACGSGNFLTETYISLRRLENEALKAIHGEQMLLNMDGLIKVGISQFYGIEINDFAVTVAKTALWIAECQMMSETEEIVEHELDFLPLKSYANITEANALRIDWADVVPKDKLSYIMGNPPFVGARLMNQEQREDVNSLFGKEWKNTGNLDYVTCWYKKSLDYIKETTIHCALVSTSSIVEGEAVGALWKPLFKQGIHINFAHTSFKWNSESRDQAQVYCVIIGFSLINNVNKKLFSNGIVKTVNVINAYLSDVPNIFIERINKTLCDVPKLHKGCQPTDGGNLIIEEEDYEDFLKKEPAAKKYIKKLIGAKEFLQNKNRYCLWLVGISPVELKSMPLVMDRVKKCKEMRLSAKDIGTKKLADKPTQFREIYNYDNYLVIPKLTSADKKYVPMGFFDKNTISTDLNYITSNATLFHFGVLTSNVHMAWMRVVCGKMGNAYRYSAGVVYNNFPWCNPTDEQKKKIEQTAQAILDARALYPDCSLADLYDELAMPPELRKAHQHNDLAVMNAYGFDKKITESECVAELMKMYQQLTREE